MATKENPVRFAVVTSTDSELETVQRYLPSNYSAMQGEDAIVIMGRDNRGWTLDGYVIPRLASGMHYAKEML